MKPKTIVKFRIDDYSKFSDIEVLMSLSKYYGKMEAIEKVRSREQFNKVFGIFLNVKKRIEECEKRFDVIFDEDTDFSDSLDDILKNNGIDPSKN